MSLSGDSAAMCAHTGTHVDSLDHLGYCGEIWNGFTERGVLVDVAAALDRRVSASARATS